MRSESSSRWNKDGGANVKDGKMVLSKLRSVSAVEWTTAEVFS